MQVYPVNRPAGHAANRPVNLTVADRLHSAAIHLLRRLRRQDDAMGLTPARASALSIMVFGGPVTLGQLAAAEQVSAPTTTRLVIGMERDGLVRREDDPNDGRVVWLHPTAKGTRLLHEGRQRRVAALAADIARLDEADRETLAVAADIIERVLVGSEQDATASAGRMGGTGRTGRMGGMGRMGRTGGTGGTGRVGTFACFRGVKFDDLITRLRFRLRECRVELRRGNNLDRLGGLTYDRHRPIIRMKAMRLIRLTTWLLLSGLFYASAPLRAQSLGDVAKKEEERRKAVAREIHEFPGEAG